MNHCAYPVTPGLKEEDRNLLAEGMSVDPKEEFDSLRFLEEGDAADAILPNQLKSVGWAPVRASELTVIPTGGPGLKF